MHSALDRFSRWFGSAAGVIQTFVIVVAVVVLEYLDPHLDPHWFWLLVWLTVYSAITQPALAFGNEKASRQLVEQAEQNAELERQNNELLTKLQALLDHHGVEVPE